MSTSDFINKVTCKNHLLLLPEMDSDSIDLIVTSPPYDSIRDYTDGKTIDRIALGKELFRVAKNGAVCAVIIQDGTANFKKSLTTARWQVEWVDQIGWNLFECCIYGRDGKPGAWWSKRFRVDHEYILLFFKGEKPKFFDKEPLKVPAKHAGVKWHGTQRMTDGSLSAIEPKVQADTKCRGTIWKYKTSNTEGDKLKMEHPATMPEDLARDIILCFSEKGDLVLDPCMGSGTTAVQSKKLGRNFVGIDLSAEYCEIARKRISKMSTDDIFSTDGKESG